MELFKIFGTIAINNSDANDAIDETTGKTERSESKITSAFKKIGTAIVSYMAIDKIKSFGQECVNMASDVQEVQNKFDVVFQGMTDDVEEWSKSYADSIGRNRNTIKAYLADNQNMFVGMGMTREQGAKLSEQMVELGLDLASFNNLQEDDAVNALSKALMGESEAAKTLGAVLNENTIAMAMNEMGIKGKFDALSEAEKMEVRYQAILMQSTDAVGDCARSLDSYKGRQIQAQSAMENLKETIGTRLIPYMTSLQEKFGSIVGTLSEYVNPAFDKLEEIGGKISVYWSENLWPAIQNVGAGFGAVWNALQPVIQSFIDLLPQTDSNKSAMDLLKDAADGIVDVLGWLSEKLQAVSTWISEHQTAVEVMATIIGSVAAAIVLVNAAVTAWNVVAGIATGVTTALGAAVAFLTSPIGIVIVIITALIAVGVTLYKNWDTIVAKCSEFGTKIKNKFNEIKDNVVGKFNDIKQGISDKINAARDTVKGAIDKIKEFFKFDWSLPKLKMPHFKITGSFSLNPPKVPSFGIDWYAKAMDEPFMFTKPTVIGNKGFGEAGDEVVYGRRNLMEDIRQAAQPDTTVLQEKMNKIIELLEQLLGMKIYLNNDVMVGELAPAMDIALGRLTSRSERGVR